MSTLTAAEILSPITQDMQAVDEIIRQRLASHVVMINQLAEHIIGSGGKRLRPALAVLAANSLNATGQQHLILAAVVEFIHTATLLHDDVVDHSDMRRGQSTANALWGNEASVLTGDFLYSRAFQLMMEIGDQRVLSVLADTTNRIAEGEVLQLMNVHNPDISEDTYNDVIERKTAILFEAAARCGALVAGGSDSEADALAQYGHHLGMAFQLIDDCLDYQADAADLGKNIGDDLSEGKVTLPLIVAMQSADANTRETLREAIRSGGLDQLDTVKHAIADSGAITYTTRRAEAAAAAAVQSLTPLPASTFKTALRHLAEFSIRRTH